jgi:hypothetical protein
MDVVGTVDDDRPENVTLPFVFPRLYGGQVFAWFLDD